MKTFTEEHRRKLSEAAKQRCTPEWRKKMSDSQIVHLDVEKVRELYNSGMTQMEIAEELGVTQKVIYGCMKRNGITARVASKRDQRGNKNTNWKGGKTLSARGYVWVRIPEHPRSESNNGYVQEHVLVMEKHLGRHLVWNGPDDPNSEVVHHINEIKTDNRVENLQLMTHEEHMRLHREKRKSRGGDANA